MSDTTEPKKKPSCEHCERAKAGVGTGYQLAPRPCIECVARSIARSTVAFDAVRTRDVTDLRTTLQRVLPAVPFERARAMVSAWWKLDHDRRK